MSFALALFAAGVAQAADLPRIELRDRFLRAGDLADLAGREDAVLSEIPAGRDLLRVDVETAKQLLKSRFPDGRFVLQYSTTVLVAAPASATFRGKCFEARHDIHPGAAIRDTDVTASQCNEAKLASGLAYDRDRNAPIAKNTIIAGDYLGPIRPLDTQIVERGARMTFRTGEGPVLIERRVETLQPGRVGKRVFARTDDGQVISAPLLENEEAAE